MRMALSSVIRRSTSGSRLGDVTYDEYETEVESSDGTFTLKVEAGGQYKLVPFISPQLREAGYFEPDAQLPTSTPPDLPQLRLLSISWLRRTSSPVRSLQMDPLSKSAYVYAWSDDDLYADATTDAGWCLQDASAHRFQMVCRSRLLSRR